MVYGALIATQRCVLVAKKPGEVVLEVKMESVSFVKPEILRVTVASRDAKSLPAALALEVKIGEEETISVRMTERTELFPQFMDVKARLGRELVDVGGKKLLTTHFHHGIGSDYWDYWISEDALPLGFVRSSKMTAGLAAVFELQALGAGGKPEIHGPVRYVDGEEFARRMAANLRKR